MWNWIWKEPQAPVDPRQPWQLANNPKPDHPARQAPGKATVVIHNQASGVNVGVPLRGCPPRMAGLAKPSTPGQFEVERRSHRGAVRQVPVAAGHCTSATPVPRNSTGNGFGCSFADARRQEFEPSNHLGELTAKNLPPPGRGPMLRDGPALAIPDRDGETGPATRLQREGILIPDLMVAFEINVADVIARRGYPMLSIAWRLAFLAWVGAPWGNPSPAPGGNWSTGAPAIAPGSSRQRSQAESPATSGRA